MAAGTGVGLIALAALFWGLTGGVGGWLIDQGWDAFALSFYRGLIGLMVVAIWLAVQPHRSGLDDRRMLAGAVIAGLGVASQFSFYLLSMAYASVAIAVTLLYSAPVFVYLGSFAVGLERVTGGKCLAITGVVIGITLLTGAYHVNAAQVPLFGVACGLAAGFSYAVFIFGFRMASARGSPQAVMTVAFTSLCVVLSPWAVPDAPPLLAGMDLAALLALGVFGAGLSFVVYVVGLRHTKPSTAAVTGLIEPLAASLFGMMILGQSLGWMQFGGMVIILTTVTGLNVANARQQPSD